MRICPNCGYRDAECWKNLRFSLYQQYCHIDELADADKELAAGILAFRPTIKRPYADETFAYTLTRTNHVRRMALTDFVNYGGFRRESQHGIESWRYAQRIALADKQPPLEKWFS